jgi:hypothetical protein
LGCDIRSNFKSGGSLSAADVPLLEDAEWLFTEGRYEISFRREVPQLRLASLEVAIDDETYQGQGASLENGRAGWRLSMLKRCLHKRRSKTCLPDCPGFVQGASALNKPKLPPP